MKRLYKAKRARILCQPESLLPGKTSVALAALMSLLFPGASPGPHGVTLLFCSLLEVRAQQESLFPLLFPCGVPVLHGCLLFPSLSPFLLSTVVTVTNVLWP